MSRIGGWPKKRLYSRLNWLALSYPTSKAALAASSPSTSMQAARGLQAQLLLILQRAHGGQRAEMMVQRGDSHAGDFREIFDAQRLGVVGPDPGDGFCGAVALISESCNRAKARPLRPAKNSVNDLALNQAAEKRNVLRGVRAGPRAGSRR